MEYQNGGSAPSKPKPPPKPSPCKGKEGSSQLTSERYFRENPISRQKPPLAPKPVLVEKKPHRKLIIGSELISKSVNIDQSGHQTIDSVLSNLSDGPTLCHPNSFHVGHVTKLQNDFSSEVKCDDLDSAQRNAEKIIQDTWTSLQNTQFLSFTVSSELELVNKNNQHLSDIVKNSSFLHSSKFKSTTCVSNANDNVDSLVTDTKDNDDDIESSLINLYISPPTPDSSLEDFVLVNKERIYETELPKKNLSNQKSLDFDTSFIYSVNNSESNVSNLSKEFVTSSPENDDNRLVSSVSESDVNLRNKKPIEQSRASWSEENITVRERTNSIGNESFDGSHTTVRGGISSFFGSFGKGTKIRDKRESSLFYCNPGDDSSQMESSDSGKNSITSLNDSSINMNNCNNSINSLVNNTKEMCIVKDTIEGGSNRSSISDESIDIERNAKLVFSEKGDFTVASPSDRKEKKCFFIVNELMTSERVFVDVLKLLCIDFKNAVDEASNKQKCNVIPLNDLNKITNNLPQLLSLNKELLRDIETRLEGWKKLPKVSDVIVKKGPFLKLYLQYIQNFQAQTDFLDECCEKYRKFAQVVRDFESSDRCKKLALKHYMLKPIQRIPQYRLLLDDYLEHQEPDSLDYNDTVTALKIVCDVADHVNSSIKQGDHFSKLLSIQSQLGDYEIIKPGRHFVKEGELHKLSRKEMQQRFFILLSDCLLYTSYYGSMTGLKVKYKLQLAGMKISTSHSNECNTEFSIITSTRSFTLRAKSQEECIEWVEAIRTAIKDYNSRQMTFCNKHIEPMSASVEPLKIGREAPVWIQDKRVTMCQICTEEFTITFRRHHCRACGKVVCSICSDYKAPMLYLKFSADRVCIECFQYLLKEFDDPETNMASLIKEVFSLSDGELPLKVAWIHSIFKKIGQSSGKKSKKYIPQRLKEVTANDSGSQMSGWLLRKSRTRWKRLWFVLKEQVLYVYRASEDVVASESIPVLGYSVEPMPECECDDISGEPKYVFKLSHMGQPPLVFATDSHSTQRWISSLQEASLLK